METKLFVRNRSDLIECLITHISNQYVLAVTNRNFIEKFMYDIKIPEICGEEFLKCEVTECQQIKPQTYQLKFSFELVKNHLLKNIEKYVHTYFLKKFGLAVARASTKVLETVLKTKLENVRYQMSDPDSYHFIKSVIISVEGELNGTAILSFSDSIRNSVAKEMWAFMQIELNDEAIIEAIKEFANFTLGNTVTILANNMGIVSDIKPPLIIDDKIIKATEKLEIHQVLIEFNIGQDQHALTLILLQSI